MQSFPYPFREIFAGWIFEAFDIVEAIMIELVEQWLKGTPQVGKIHHPTGILAN